MNAQEQKRLFLDLNWTVRVRWFYGIRTRKWLASINISRPRGMDVECAEMGPEQAEDLIRLIRQAVAQAREWERIEAMRANEEREAPEKSQK